MTDFIKARKKEMSYHEQFYRDTALFEPGTWLSKPVKVVMNMLPRLDLNKKVRVLDLGCGVGRNSIPVAHRIQDLLPVAIDKLRTYAEEYKVNEIIHTEVADAEFYQIKPGHFDYIIACSCLEHVSSIAAFRSVIQRMINGTKHNGIHCILMSTEVMEYQIETGEETEGEIELNLKTEEAFNTLRELYIDWEILIQRVVPQTINEHKCDKEIEFRSNWLTFAARKRDNQNRGEIGF
ncbi:Methyltransferase domain-containing protein [Paenibacillus sophorae]|uniref:Class I SAM-dependent methyltransferase n=1 Tax=Paenibacillus sophorae TaxID=1333845 RepID=A0A1H8QV92_9BACL|nr:class I SAM-dependent methyltransferase [Paenibacillus sophorae]SEO58105.1 Methyltransferase domain-containing protein [Paenibacillus sophorae]